MTKITLQNNGMNRNLSSVSMVGWVIKRSVIKEIDPKSLLVYLQVGYNKMHQSLNHVERWIIPCFEKYTLKDLIVFLNDRTLINISGYREAILLNREVLLFNIATDVSILPTDENIAPKNILERIKVIDRSI